MSKKLAYFVMLLANLYLSVKTALTEWKNKYLADHGFKPDTWAKATGDAILEIIISIVAGLFAVAYVLPAGMQALGGANTTGWPTGTADFIIPIGIFVMIGLLFLFAKASKT